MPALTHWSHPSFFAYFATSTSAPGIFGELLSAAFDNKAMLWRTSPASTELEEVTLDWLRQMMGLDAGMTGIIYDTASVSSMHAIAAAREGVELRIREEGMSGRARICRCLRVYVSEQAHSSIEKGVITLGLGQRGLRKIPTDSEFRMDVKALAAAIEEDKANGIVPFCIVATVGTDVNFEHRSGSEISSDRRAACDVAARGCGLCGLGGGGAGVAAYSQRVRAGGFSGGQSA